MIGGVEALGLYGSQTSLLLFPPVRMRVIPERLASNLGDRAGGQGDLRSLFTADIWIQSGHQHQTIAEMLSMRFLLGRARTSLK